MRKPKEDITLCVSRRELATILAALRFHQDENLQGGCEILDQAVLEIATDCGQLEPLTFEEVSNLCGRMNLGRRLTGGLSEDPVDWHNCQHQWQETPGPTTGCGAEYWFQCRKCGATRYRCVEQDGSSSEEIHPPDEEGDAYPGADLESLRLVKVCWGEDTGLVSLALRATLCYAWDFGSRQFSVPKGTPTVEITDREMDEAFGDEATWDDVPRFLVQRAREYGLADLVTQDSDEESPQTKGTNP
ncbi:MAG TPA: hypothetical protein VNA25_16595 [Phycisphaerae bacterium]|nr:hypothetical protein [Phycisphaerae bacterium]